MGKAYPKDMKAKFKARVMALVQKDHTFIEIAEELGIASSFAFQLACEEREYKSDLVEKIRYLRFFLASLDAVDVSLVGFECLGQPALLDALG